ncbi:pyocin activator PrtN family protein [Pseudomonas sp. A6]|uniref:pyocin activator PrtN family protein n=1 Tax=Pseudomonas sp. A6 TaxID=410021 RepID=UPI0040287681
MLPSNSDTQPAPRQETVALVYQIFGDVLVPLEQVRERWFRNLNRENFGKALACGRIALPVTTLDDSHKAMQYVAVDHLAAYVEQRASLADAALARRRAGQQGQDGLGEHAVTM